MSYLAWVPGTDFEGLTAEPSLQSGEFLSRFFLGHIAVLKRKNVFKIPSAAHLYYTRGIAEKVIHLRNNL